MGKQPTVIKLQKLAANPDEPFDREIGRLAKLQVKTIGKLTVGVKSGDVDAIHDMRVATRRIRALIRLKRDLTKGKALKPIAEFAKELGSHLGEVRAEDVLLISLRKLGSSNALRALELGVTYRRKIRADQLREILESKAFAAWGREVEDEMIDRVEVAQPVKELAPRAIEIAFDTVYAHRNISSGADLPELHALRIDSKKLRYVLEFFGRSTTWDAMSTLGKLVELQDHLGALHDDELLLLEIRSALSLNKAWSPEDIDHLNKAAEKVEISLRRRQTSAPAKWHFLFDESLIATLKS